MTARKWAMTQVGDGDWMLPSNDLRTMYRLTRYEDGRVYGLDRGPQVFNLWMVRAMPTHLFAERLNHGDDFDCIDGWREVEYGCRTRREAIERALADEQHMIDTDPRPPANLR